MKDQLDYDAIIIGGSYAGLSGAMALARSLCRVLIIDGGKPCNRQTPHSHNFITQDGETPAAIAAKAKAQVLAYDTVGFLEDQVTTIAGADGAFTVLTASGKEFNAAKVLLTAGIKDVMMDIPGLAACWGISVLHCPYCHGYEVRHESLGILSNGADAMEYAKLIRNWSANLRIFTNGPATFTPEQWDILKLQGITVSEQPLAAIEHTNGQLQAIRFNDGTTATVTALFARMPLVQHDWIQQLSLELNEQGMIKLTEDHQTSIPGMYAAGDCTTPMRSVVASVASGNLAAVFLSKSIIAARWNGRL